MSNKQRAVIYYLVSGYIFYMVYQIAKNHIQGDKTFSLGLCIAICGIMSLIDLAVVIYTTKNILLADRKTEELSTEELSTEELSEK